MMSDNEGNSTGHLMGFIYKSLMFLELGIKPIWIFDGIPPEEKKRELKKRRDLKNQAE
jgi:flap endonuclease-1